MLSSMFVVFRTKSFVVRIRLAHDEKIDRIQIANRSQLSEIRHRRLSRAPRKQIGTRRRFAKKMSKSQPDAKALHNFMAKHKLRIRDLRNQTHFDATELNSIVEIYFHVMSADQGSGGGAATHMIRRQFRAFLHVVLGMPEDEWIERILTTLDGGLLVASNQTTSVSLETWVRSMSLFLHGTLDERMRYCYRVYDLLGHGGITHEHLSILMRNPVVCKYVEDAEEATKDIIDELILLLDRDLDGAISYEDYSTVVREKPALLEAIGRVLPERATVHAFVATFTHAYYLRY